MQHATATNVSVPLDKLSKKFIQEVTGVFLFLASGFNNAHPPQCPHVQTSGTYRKKHAKMPLILGLFSIARRSHRNLPCERHETHNPQQCILPLGTESLQQSRRPHVHGRLGGNTHKQWGSISQIIKAVMSSATEVELGVLFINAKMALSMRQTLKEMGYPQPRTPIQTNNSTAHALLTNRILPKALKAMDMRFNWLRYRDPQGQYRIYWRPGMQNLADYWTKHHPASHHKSFRPQILTSPKDPEYQKLTTPQNTMSKLFVKNILKPPIFAEQIAAKQQTLAARSA